MKEFWIAAQEELIAEYLERFPHKSEEQAYLATADKVEDRLTDKMARLNDYKRMLETA